jgi:hypothetical protein
MGCCDLALLPYIGACYQSSSLPDDYSLLMLEAWNSLPLTRLMIGGKTDIIIAS